MTDPPELAQTASSFAQFVLQQQKQQKNNSENGSKTSVEATIPQLTTDLDHVLSKSLLSDKAILHHLTQSKRIIITPFHPENLSTTSYDVTLGKYYFRETDAEPAEGIFNPYSESMVKRVWGMPKEGELVQEWTKRTGIQLENVRPYERVIWVKPGQFEILPS